MSVHDPRSDRPRTAGPAIAEMLGLHPTGPASWAGACPICRGAGTFKLTQDGPSIRWRCAACGRDRALMVAMRRIITRERQSRAGR